MRAPRTRERTGGGFTLVELVVGLSILLICTLALGLSLQAGAAAARQMREEQVILAEAQSIVDRIVAQEFGHDYDPEPLANQLEEIFDADAASGDITLHQLSRWPAADGGWRFELAAFPIEGEWRVRVDMDLDSDGLIAGDLESGGRVFRVTVFFNDRPVLWTNRSKEVTL